MSFFISIHNLIFQTSWIQLAVLFFSAQSFAVVATTTTAATTIQAAAAHQVHLQALLVPVLASTKQHEVGAFFFQNVLTSLFTSLMAQHTHTRLSPILEGDWYEEKSNDIL